MREIKGSGFEKPHQVGVYVQRKPVDLVSVDAEKHVCGREGHTLVAIYERMIDRQTFEECSGFGDDISVIACLRAKQGGFQRSGIAETGCSAIALNQRRMHSQHIGYGEVISRRHFASSRYNSSNSPRLCPNASIT